MTALTLSFHIDFVYLLWIHFEISIHVHKAVDLLLDICYLCVTVANNIRGILYSRGDPVETLQEFLFGTDRVAISPIIFSSACKSYAAIFAYDACL